MRDRWVLMGGMVLWGRHSLVVSAGLQVPEPLPDGALLLLPLLKRTLGAAHCVGVRVAHNWLHWQAGLASVGLLQLYEMLCCVCLDHVVMQRLPPPSIWPCCTWCCMLVLHAVHERPVLECYAYS